CSSDLAAVRAYHPDQPRGDIPLHCEFGVRNGGARAARRRGAGRDHQHGFGRGAGRTDRPGGLFRVERRRSCHGTSDRPRPDERRHSGQHDPAGRVQNSDGGDDAAKRPGRAWSPGALSEAPRPAGRICRARLFSHREPLHECGGGTARRRDPDGAPLNSHYRRLTDDLAVAACEAGEAILEIVRRGFEIESKHDSSPVTEADRAAELIILAALARAAPGIPVIAEEEVAAGRIPAHDQTYFLVDPLDGTKEFIRGGEDYTVNIGLIDNGSPKLGVVFAPATGRPHGGCVGEGAWVEEAGHRMSIRTRARG